MPIARSRGAPADVLPRRESGRRLVDEQNFVLVVDVHVAVAHTHGLIIWSKIAAAAEVHLARIADREVFRIEAGAFDARAQIVSMHTGKQVRINDAVGTTFDDCLLVAFVGIGFGGGNPGRSDTTRSKRRTSCGRCAQEFSAEWELTGTSGSTA